MGKKNLTVDLRPLSTVSANNVALVVLISNMLDEMKDLDPGDLLMLEREADGRFMLYRGKPAEEKPSNEEGTA